MKESTKTATIIVAAVVSCSAVVVFTSSLASDFDRALRDEKPKRIVDAEAGVVCYTYRDSISCVPEMLTKLKSGPEAR